MALFIVTLLSRTGRQTECQQATVVALQIEAAELTTLQRLAAPEAFQIQRKQFLILAQPAQQHVAAASLQTDASQPEPARRVPIGQGRQHWREAAAQLAIERAQMRCEALQLAVLRFPLRQLRRQPGIQRRFPIVSLECSQLRLC